MLHVLKPHLEVVNLFVSSIAGLASVMIAYFAYQIDNTVQERASKEAQMGRSVALFQSIIEDESIKELFDVGVSVEAAIHAATPGQESPDDYKTLEARYLAVRMNDDKELLPSLISLLQHINRAVKCVNIADGENLETSFSEFIKSGSRYSQEALCDQKTLLSLSGEMFSDLYMYLRPILTCDEFFNRGKELKRYQNLIRYYYKQEDQEIHTGNEINSHVGLENSGTKRASTRENNNDIVIEFGPKQHCDTYQDIRKELMASIPRGDPFPRGR